VDEEIQNSKKFKVKSENFLATESNFLDLSVIFSFFIYERDD